MMMAAVIGAYTACNISDKYIVSKGNINKNDYTFFLSLSSLIFLTFFLPFTDHKLQFSIYNAGIILGAAASKIVEFRTLAAVLKEMTPFEVKAWLGICIFLSYITDMIMKADSFRLSRLSMILITAMGLILIVWDNQRSINYKKIMFYLVLHILSKYLYGIVIKQAAKTMSTTMTLYCALIIVMILMLVSVHPIRIFKGNKKSISILCGTRLVNVIGNIAENEVIKMSLVQYSLIQPGILVLLFLERMLRKERFPLRNIIGSVLCVLGVLGFSIC